jgi:hypothetical protein
LVTYLRDARLAFVAEVDHEDDSIRRCVVRHYAYDPDRHERRHMTVAAFDNEGELLALFGRLSEELRRRRDDGDEVDHREHYSGVVLEAGHSRLQQNGRLIRDAMARGAHIDRLLEDLEPPLNVAVVSWEIDDGNSIDNS